MVISQQRTIIFTLPNICQKCHTNYTPASKQNARLSILFRSNWQVLQLKKITNFISQYRFVYSTARHIIYFQHLLIICTSFLTCLASFITNFSNKGFTFFSLIKVSLHMKNVILMFVLCVANLLVSHFSIISIWIFMYTL